MGVVPLLVVCSIIVAGGFLVAFIYASRKGQYDDMETPSIRMVFDDVTTENSKTHSTTNKRV